MMKRLNAVVFNPGKNYSVSLIVFWASCFLAPATMIGRCLTSGFDLFEQVLLAISWYAIIETARNSVITSMISKTVKLLLLCSLLVSCAPKRPRTQTVAPSLGTARTLTSRLGQDITDYKGSLGRVRTLSEEIDYKASLIQ